MPEQVADESLAPIAPSITPERRIPEPKGASAQRMKKFRARRKAEKRAQKKAIQEEHWAELDRIRAERGLPPVLRGAAKLREWKKKKRAFLKRIAQDEWFSPSIDTETACDFYKTLNPTVEDNAIHLTIAVRQSRCEANSLNLNRFVVEKDVEAALAARAVFNGLVKSGLSIRDAIDKALHSFLNPEGNTPSEKENDLNTAIAEGRERWGNGKEILDSLLPSKPVEE